MKQVTIVVLVLVAFLLATCGAQPAPTASPTQAPPGMPNPASKFCVEQGYQSEIRDEADGQKRLLPLPRRLRVRGVGLLPRRMCSGKRGPGNRGTARQPCVGELRGSGGTWECHKYPYFGFSVISALDALARLGCTLEEPKIAGAVKYLLIGITL